MVSPVKLESLLLEIPPMNSVVWEDLPLIESPLGGISDSDHDMDWEEVGALFSDVLAGDELPLPRDIVVPSTLPEFEWNDIVRAFSSPIPTEALLFLPCAATSPPQESVASPTMACPVRMPHLQPKKCPKKCSVPSCWNKIRSRGYCKTHGGGKRCLMPGCNTCSVGGSYCIKHGGGKKCLVYGCSNVIQSRGVCKAHGGGARCTVPGCSKSSQGKGLCTSHGGGKRCEVEGCGKGAQTKGRCYIHSLSML
ncbi:hypothetical protein AeNC1_004796 [Aphanomyces euteiches]|nr:hypothetical protein AeNC1_004796 [Aphanomyces euteiches]